MAETLPARPFLILCTHTHNVTMTIDTAEWPLCVFILERSTVSSFSSIRRLLSQHTTKQLLAKEFHSNVPSPLHQASLQPPPFLNVCIHAGRKRALSEGQYTWPSTLQMNQMKAHSFKSTNTRLSTEFAEVEWCRLAALSYGRLVGGIRSPYSAW